MLNIENKVKEIIAGVKSDIEKLEATAKELQLPLAYTNQDYVGQQRINKEFILYPLFDTNNIYGLDTSKCIERVKKLLSETDTKFKEQVRRTFSLMKNNQVKVEDFYWVRDLRMHLDRVSGLEFPYMSREDREGHNNYLIKKQQNGKAVYQFTEAQYNYIKDIIEG